MNKLKKRLHNKPFQRTKILEDIRLAETQLAQGKGVSHEPALKQVLARVIQ